MRRDFPTKGKALPWGLMVTVLAVLALLCFCGLPQAEAIETNVAGLSVMGYINQSTAYALHSNQPGNKDGFNSFLTQALLETRYEAAPNLVMFNSLKLNADWAYPLYSGNNEWRDKGFDKARDRLFLYDKFRDFVGEAHLTWKPTDRSYIRVGKQIVQWGETDGFLLMNQINPIDQRRGIADVEFETSIIPTWLIRAEYRPPIQTTWLQDVNLQFIFDPNADFAKNESIDLGADYSGVWNPYVVAIPGVAYLGRYRDVLSQPDAWDPQGHAFGGRVSGVVADARVTLNGYYGRSHELARSGAIGADFTAFKWDPNWLILHPYYEAYYPYFRFVGGTFSKDLDFLRASFLGGVAPVLRMEGLYAFNSTFSTNNNNIGQYMQEQNNNFWTSDEYRWMAGFDWKVKINALNPKAFFFISPQVYQRHIMDYPKMGHVGTYTTDIQYQDTWTTSLMVNTTYLHNKLQPSFFWLRNWSTRSEFFRPQISYEYSDKWKYTIGAIICIGEKFQQDMQPFNDKDNIYGTVSYKF